MLACCSLIIGLGGQAAIDRLIATVMTYDFRKNRCIEISILIREGKS